MSSTGHGNCRQPPARIRGPPGEKIDTPYDLKKDNKVGTDAVDPPPVLARIADESRVAFEVPAGFEAPYTLAGLLAACEQLAPSIPVNALPRQDPVLVWNALPTI